LYDDSLARGIFQRAEMQDQEVAFSYTGSFVEGVFHGHGAISKASSSYEGSWHDGKMHGRGILRTSEYTYEGLFEGGVRSDKEAKCTYRDGSTYTGSFRKNNRNGFGVLTAPCGRLVYQGKWIGDKRCGKGLWMSALGDTYTGSFEDGLPCGTGTMTYVDDRSVYTGEWRMGKREGWGTVTRVDGSVTEGLFKNDRYVGAATLQKK